MKNILIASIVGGILLFLWQFVSWGAANFHEPVQQYTEKQDAIMSFLNSQGLEEGGYIMPSLPKTASQEEWEKMMEETQGKPWASVQYHKAMDHSMGMNITRGLIIDILTVLLLCWIIRQFSLLSFSNIMMASLAAGMIVFFNANYTHYIWYRDADIWIHLMDAVVSWGLVGLWLGWYLPRRLNKRTIVA